MSRFVQLLVLSAMMMATTPAFADALTPRSVSVRSDDLNLADARDAARMLRRLEGAADAVCGRAVVRHFQGRTDPYPACRAATLAAAVDQVGAPLVAALYAARNDSGEIEVADR